MKAVITATELARNLSRVLDQLIANGGELVVERNSRQVARITAAPGEQNALEAMADLYRTLSEEAANEWEMDIRRQRLKGSRLDKALRDPWRS